MMGLSIYTIYDHPSGYPDYYVVRLWISDKPTELVHLFNNLDEPREILRNMGLTVIPRDPTDDKTIIESWI